MDEKDLELLRILEENSRLSAEEIATMTSLTAGEVAARVCALEAAQVIKGYSTVINWEKAGNGEVSAIIELKVSPERDYGYDRIAERLSRFRQVKTLRLMTGTYDLQLLVTWKKHAGSIPVCIRTCGTHGPDPGDRDAHHHEVVQRERQYAL